MRSMANLNKLTLPASANRQTPRSGPPTIDRDVATAEAVIT